MRLGFYGLIVLLALTLSLLAQLLPQVFAQPFQSGEAYAVTEYRNQVCTSIKTKSGVILTFTDMIESWFPSSSSQTRCGWFKSKQQIIANWHTNKRGQVIYYWEFMHGICLPIIGCIVDQVIEYTAGVTIKLIKIYGTYYCDALPVGSHYSYTETKGACM